MTPLAQKMFLRKPKFVDDDAGVSSRIPECQFFDVSAAFDLVNDMAWDVVYGKKPLSCEGLFLPAEPCWIEWSLPETGHREASFLERRGDQIFGSNIHGSTSGWVGSFPFRKIGEELSNQYLVHPLQAALNKHDIESDPTEEEFVLHERISAALFLGIINTPKIIGRKQHMPSRKLEKRLMARNRNVGKFPLGAWTEILLHVTPPLDVSDDASVEAHYTGKKAMHFCRAHLRLRLGRLEVVRGHWRGDPSIGVKRSRYRLSGSPS